jgi:hypothetical protein
MDRGHGGVPGQGYLAIEGEIAGAEVGFPGAQDETGLGQIHLPRHRQHGGVVEAVGVEYHGAGIAFQATPGEGVDLHEGVMPGQNLFVL